MKNDKGLFIKNPNFWRIPRKKKKQIPKDTFYCYTPLTKPGFMEDGRWGYKIKCCPFWTYIKAKDKPKEYQTELDKKYPELEDGWCTLIKYDIMDQCKSCGQRYGKW